MKIDVISLSDSIRALEKEITSFEDNELNLFSKIMSLRSIWNDGYSTSFYEKIEEEKKLFDLLVQDLKSFKNIYNYVYDTSSKYGKKIQVDFNYLSNVTSQYNSCKQYFNTINSLYNSLDLRECRDVASRIQSQKAKFNNTNKQLDNYINRLNDVIKTFKTMEQEVTIRNNSLNLNNINSIDFYNLPTIDPNTRLVGMSSTDDIEAALSNISINIEAEEEIITRINNIFVTIRNYYISNINQKVLNNKQLDFNCQFKVLKNNHNNLLQYVNNLKEIYLSLEKKIEGSVDKEIKKVA